MTTIHLMSGFIGFGKTTVARRLTQTLPAVCLTHDHFMVKLYGRNMPYADFHPNYEKVDNLLWELAAQITAAGTDVIMDYGFWTHESRRQAYAKAQKLADKVIFHVVKCDMPTARRRILQRSQENSAELLITDAEFTTLSQQYQPWDANDAYPAVLYNAPTTDYIGQIVPVKIDRPHGSKHPKFGYEYPLNYGFVPYTESGDGEELDAYVLGVDKPLQEYVGRCVAVIHRTDDDDDKLVIAPLNAAALTAAEIEQATAFQEKWFKHVLWR